MTALRPCVPFVTAKWKSTLKCSDGFFFLDLRLFYAITSNLGECFVLSSTPFFFGLCDEVCVTFGSGAAYVFLRSQGSFSFYTWKNATGRIIAIFLMKRGCILLPRSLMSRAVIFSAAIARQSLFNLQVVKLKNIQCLPA